MDAANVAFKTAFPLGEPILLQKAEKSRMKSEDMSQEAEGLKRNAEDMKYNLDKVRKPFFLFYNSILKISSKKERISGRVRSKRITVPPWF